MPSNSATEKIKRAKRHLLAARILLQSLPANYWGENDVAQRLDSINEKLKESQSSIETIKPRPGKRK